jgi:hypothetical protein
MSSLNVSQNSPRKTLTGKFNERRRVGSRQDDEPRLQKTIQEGNVEALFARMWLSSIVEFSDDAIKLEQRCGAALWL